MKISSVKLLKEERGLKQVNMGELGDVVLLTGANGSGKTRLLNLIAQELNVKDSEILEISTSDSISSIKLTDYSFTDSRLQLPEKFPSYVISSSFDRLKVCDFSNTVNDSLLFIQSLLKHDEALENFNSILKEFMGTRIFFENGEPRFFGLNFAKMQLSPGQQYILRMCVAIFCNNPNDAPIIFMDEPEVHLHPNVLIDLIHKLSEKFTDTQIWIATHSIALLSMYQTSDIWYFDKGRVSKIGSNSQKMISGLLGGEENRLKLQQFMLKPFQFAYNRFAFEALFGPKALAFRGGTDPQVQSIVESLNDKINNKAKLTVVDFGVGKGRLIEALSENEIFMKLNYFAYDKYDDDKEQCITLMKQVGLDERRYFNDIDSLKKELPQKADAIFLVNVLHEIDPVLWEEVLKDNIFSLLKSDGILILVEIEEFKYGEKPYPNGFIVLQEKALAALLGGNAIKPYRDEKYASLVAYRIPQPYLLNIQKDTVYQSMLEIKKKSLKMIREIRKEGALYNFKSGLRHAFWTHQFANSALSEISISETP